jgi:hypothetical protein
MTNLAQTLHSLGDLAEARKLQEEALELCLRHFGLANVHTAAAAWNLYKIVYDSGDLKAAPRILDQHLVWLTNREPETLSQDERRIREEVEQCLLLFKIIELRKRAERQDLLNSIRTNAAGMPLRVAKIGRNDPCPCGSKLKYKKCCGA